MPLLAFLSPVEAGITPELPKPKKDNVISAGCTVLCQGLFEVLAFDQLLRSSSFDPTGNEAFQVHNVNTYQHDSEEKKHQ